jgi:hypothetical protein
MAPYPFSGNPALRLCEHMGCSFESGEPSATAAPSHLPLGPIDVDKSRELTIGAKVSVSPQLKNIYLSIERRLAGRSPLAMALARSKRMTQPHAKARRFWRT